jgi:hypothetical protein
VDSFHFSLFGNFGGSGNVLYPCLCLCFEFSQITRTTPLRCTILHLSQIFFTDALTFMFPALFVFVTASRIVPAALFV